MQRTMGFDAAHYGFPCSALWVSMQCTMDFHAAHYGFRCSALWISMLRTAKGRRVINNKEKEVTTPIPMQ